MPFASQAVFERGDSNWANAHRTGFADLARLWTARAELLPPYASLDLVDLSHSAPGEADYRPAAAVTVAALTQARLADEAAAELTAAEVTRLEGKLNAWRWLLWTLFPRGFGFRLGERRLAYSPRRGKLSDTDGERAGDFEISMPALTLKEALRNNHLSDLGITMFVRVRLWRRLDPRKVYGLFVLFQFDDYGHLRSAGASLRWMRAILRDLWPPAVSSR
jgi:hypothetical protein